jgi:hypothetical protein
MKNPKDEQIEIEYEKDYDPKWKEALLALQGWDPASKTYKSASDPRPIAELLMAGEVIPTAVSRMLATMLYPHDHWKGGRLVLQRPKTENFAKHWERAKLIAEIQKLNSKLISENASYDVRLYSIQDKFKITRGTAALYMGLDSQTKFKKYLLPISPGIKGPDDSKK